MLHTRGLTSSFPVTENMRARPSGVHTVGTESSHLPGPSFRFSLHHFPISLPPFLLLPPWWLWPKDLTVPDPEHSPRSSRTPRKEMHE